MQTPNEFHDPALKDAVRRCWAGDCATTELRTRIGALLANADRADERMVITPERSKRSMTWAVWSLAAAAMLILSFGIYTLFIKRGPIDVASALPPELENALIHTHDGCCNAPDHQGLPVPKSDDTAIADAMRIRLHQPVLMTHPDESGWTFRGASMCPVGGITSGHLVFSKGDERLSVFTLPKSMLPSAVDGSNFAGTLNNHCIVGFVKDGALFCAVETGPAGAISIQQLQQMSDQMKSAVAVTPVRSTDVQIAELLQPVHQ